MCKTFSRIASVVVSLMLAALTALFTLFPSSPAPKADEAQTLRTDEAGNTIVDTRNLGLDIRGYAGPTPLFITIDKEQRITNIELQDNQESREYLAEVKSARYFKNWLGKTVDEALQKEVDAVSGATMSSRAIAQNVQVALQYYKNGAEASFDWTIITRWLWLAVFVVSLVVLLKLSQSESKSLRWILLVLFLGSLLPIIYQAFAKSCKVSFGRKSLVDEKTLVLDYIAARSNVKRFSDQPIARPTLDSLIAYGRMAGTGRDDDARRYIIINDEARLDSLMPAEIRHRKLGDAKTVIILCGDTQVLDHHDRPTNNYLLYGAQAAQNMALAAQAMGLSAGVMNFTDERSVRGTQSALGLPENIVPFCAIAVGYAKIQLPKQKLEVPTQDIHENQW